MEGGLLGVLSGSRLHDVDLTRGGPPTVNLISGHHPKGGPEVDTVGELGVEINTSIFPFSGGLCVDSSRSITLSVIVLGYGCDDERTVSDGDVLGLVGVTLEFVVTSTVTVLLDCPFRKVE